MEPEPSSVIPGIERDVLAQREATAAPPVGRMIQVEVDDEEDHRGVPLLTREFGSSG